MRNIREKLNIDCTIEEKYNRQPSQRNIIDDHNITCTIEEKYNKPPSERNIRERTVTYWKYITGSYKRKIK